MTNYKYQMTNQFQRINIKIKIRVHLHQYRCESVFFCEAEKEVS